MSNNSILHLLEEGKQYFLLQFDYAKLTVTEKISVILGMSFLFFIVLILSLGGGIYLSFALVHLLKPLLGLAASYAVVGLFFLVLAGITIIFRRHLILNPITRFISRVLLNDDDK